MPLRDVVLGSDEGRIGGEELRNAGQFSGRASSREAYTIIVRVKVIGHHGFVAGERLLQVGVREFAQHGAGLRIVLSL